MNYFESLSSDMSAMGLDSGQCSQIMDYETLVKLVETISHRIGHLAEISQSTNPDLATNLVRRAFMLAKADVKFDDTFADCCEEAEPRLLEGVSPYAISNLSMSSPIVVVHDAEPVGVIKRYKIRTMYGIEDLPEHNIVSGAFHKISNNFLPEVPSTNHAWSVDLETEDAPTFEPVRLSTFVIPHEERLKLLNYEDPNNVMARIALQGTHDEIVQSIIYAHMNSEEMTKKSLAQAG